MALPEDLISRGDLLDYLEPDMIPASFHILDVMVSSASRWVKMYLNRRLMAETYTEVRNGTGQMAMRVLHWPIIEVTGVTVYGTVLPYGGGGLGIGVGGGWVNDESMIYLRRGIYGFVTVFSVGPQNVQFNYSAGYTTPGQMACNALPGWTASTAVAQYSQIWQDGGIYTAIVGGASGVTMPVLPTQLGQIVVDGSVTWRYDAPFSGLIQNATILPDDIMLATAQIAALMFKQRDRVGDTSTGIGPERVSFFMRNMTPTTKMLLDPRRDVTPVGNVP